MGNTTLLAAADLRPKWSIKFKTLSSLSRNINPPLIVDNPAGLVVFGDSSTICLAQVADPGADVYSRLSSINATTYIHGWTVNSGRLYVLDGVELASWDLRDGTKRETLKLVKKETEVKQATEALADLQKAIQKVEWATLLEQTEDEWIRLTAKQNTAAALSDERDQLDAMASDYFQMLKEMRAVVGSAGGAAAARQLIADLKRALADKRKTVAPWCFSPPVIRRHSFEEPLRALFAIQGNGTLHASDLSLSQSTSMKWKDQAERQLALIEEPRENPELLGYISNSTLYVVDARTLKETGSWSPTPAPPAEISHTLVAANGQFWWGTSAGVYALQPDKNGRVRLTNQSGPGWSTRQVGRLNTPVTTYAPPVDPNELFDTMNVRAWLEQRPNPGPQLNDGVTAQLTLSDETGKYTTPPTGTSYILYGPFAGDTSSAKSKWTHFKPHASKPLLLLSDSRGGSAFCRYSTVSGVVQLVPQWSIAPWLSSVVRYSTLDFALSRDWPTPSVRQLFKPKPDMADYLLKSPAGKEFDMYERMLSMVSKRSKLGDRDLRFLLWHALFNREVVVAFYPMPKLAANKAGLQTLFDENEQKKLRDRFGTPGNDWDIPLWDRTEGNTVSTNFSSPTPPVNFDPPWKLKNWPRNLFHSNPPLWYDPWGYNRPGDFVRDQPSATYLDPFCFDGQLHFPQRPVTFDSTFSGRRWAVFTDNDQASVLASAKSATKETATEEPVILGAAGDPDALVVSADEDLQRSIFQLLPTKPLRITFDAASHTAPGVAQFGSIASHVLTSPTVYLSAHGKFPVAWCVVNSDFPSARLRRLAATNEDDEVSLWEKFVNDNRSKFGPRDSEESWQIDKCPLPAAAQSTIILEGYSLPAKD